MMTTNYRRIALLTGVSAVALGAAPAFAATTVAPGTAHSIAAANVTDTLDISLVSDAGVKAESDPATAIVNSPATGNIQQQANATGVAPTDGNVDILITNAGAAHVGATAIAVDTTGDATAFAQIFSPGLEQLGAGAGTLGLAIDNEGALGIAAVATATAAGVAHATANFSGTGGFGFGVYQSAYGGTAGATAIDASITNGAAASLSVLASAKANGATATANANIPNAGIFQIGVNADTISIGLTNDGTIDVGANAAAVATAGDAHANATMSGGVFQVAYNGDTATASIVNDGTLNVGAHAAATAAGVADATAAIASGVGQLVLGSSAHAIISNGTAGAIAIDASAVANGGSNASAHAGLGATNPFGSSAAIGQYVNLTGGGAGSADLTNNGSIDINALASANAATVASAGANVVGALQWVKGHNGDASASLTNGGTLNVDAAANAAASSAATAAAVAIGVHQLVAATGTVGAGTTAAPAVASAAFSNSGTVSVSGSAKATATAGSAAATGTGLGVIQTVSGPGAVTLDASNSGAISVSGNAIANGALGANAVGVAGDGMAQRAVGTAVTETLGNSGTATISAKGSAVAASGPAHATGFAFWGLQQRGNGTTVAQSMTNSGIASLIGNAIASGAGTATASAVAFTAMAQTGSGAAVTQAMTNSGTVTATANATAVANGAVVGTPATATTAGVAHANASAFGMGQRNDGAAGSQAMVNSGTLNVGAHAVASAVVSADARAIDTGAFQVGGAGIAQSFTNSGSITVNASADAVALPFTVGTGTTAVTTTVGTGNAFAHALGYNGFSFGGGTKTAAVDNSGDINVGATAAAPGSAVASAQGILLANATSTFATPTTGGGTAIVSGGNPLTGTLTNSGSIKVVASAAGGVTSTTAVVATTGGGTSVVTTTHPHSSAVATGIRLNSGVNTMTVTNSGSIDVDAITANGGDATAYGIRVTSNGAATPAVGDVFTFTNDGGSMRVRQSTDGGATWHRGMAIDVASAPNNSVINLLGDGNIYGNVDVQTGDVINVQSGTTYFNGIINPEFVPAGGFTEADLDTGIAGEGTLNIDTGGNLELADPRITGDPAQYDGPAYAIVDTLNMGADGTLTFQLQPAAGGTQAVGTYPQVYADTVNLDGKLVADIFPAGGIFDDSYFWDNVIDANTRNGTFASCGLAAPYATTPLLSDLACTYDANNNVDLGLTRVAFNAVAGLTFNQNSVATGIECLYDDLGAAGLAATAMDPVVADLFKFNAADYAAALDQLSGAAYAGYLQSFGSLGYHYNSILDRATDCEVPALAGSALECRTAPMHVWAQVDYQYRKKDGDVELASSKSDRWSAMLGFDVNVGPQAVIGAAIGKVWNDVDFRDQGNSSAKGDGWMAGLYGVYDPGAFYIKALGSYSSFNGDATRHIDFTPFGGTTAGTLTGSPDVRLWTLGLHGGYRIPVSPTSVITPFVNYDYTDAKLKSFQEGGNTGAELTVNGGSHRNSWLTGGIKWAGQIGGVVPEVKVGYRYMFGEKRASFNADFLDSADCNFDIVSASEKRGAIVAGLTIGGKLGFADLRIGYEGAYNGDVTEHAGFLKVVIPLGAAAAPPPPPPPPPAPPPPPPPPATQTCADGTVILATAACPAPPPPPPPPPPAPERG